MKFSGKYFEQFQLAYEAAKTAGERILELREREEFTVSMKGDRNLVTTADLEAEKIILQFIRDVYPEHSILSEESAPSLDASQYLKPLWIIDPIDGTSNYAHGHHQVGVSIAYAEEGEVKTGVVECPFQKETFAAVINEGAFLNGHQISCGSTETLADALVGTGFPYQRPDIDEIVARVRAVLLNCRDLRRIGSGAIDICWVAAGRLDAFYENLEPWDIAAAALVAREAGAIIDHAGPAKKGMPADLNPDHFVVANSALLPLLRELLLEASRECS